MDQPPQPAAPPTLAESFRSGSAVSLRRSVEEGVHVLGVDDDTVVLTVDSAIAVGIHHGDIVQVRSADVAGHDGAAVAVTGRVTDMAFGETTTVVHVVTTSRPAISQQRRHVRIPAFDIDLSLRSLRGAAQREWFAGRGFDLSAGGVRFATARALEAGELVDIRLDLGGRRSRWTLETEAVVVWRRADEHADHVYAVRFTGLTPQVEDRIVAWVLERQTSGLH